MALQEDRQPYPYLPRHRGRGGGQDAWYALDR